MIRHLKRVAESIPAPVGRVLAGIPFSWRLGREYAISRREIEMFHGLPASAQIDRIADQLRAILKHHLGRTHSLGTQIYPREQLDELQSYAGEAFFECYARLPLLTKEVLRSYSPPEIDPGSLQLNTGGTAGSPLTFRVDRHAFAREWAHMHYIWEKLHYRPMDLKLTFRGKNLGTTPIRYNAVHNEYLVNAYLPVEKTAAAVRKIVNQVRYLHGYPSLIYQFVRQCGEDRASGHRLIDALRKNLKGILYGSEYPAPAFRDYVDSVLPVPSIAWYGHSEMCILAYEVARNIYRPFHTYGFTEAVKLPAEASARLVGSSYHNTAFPFIRYDTGDLLESEHVRGFVESFTIREGRIGDFVTDRAGHPISLTALIFGRHHRFFERGEFVQVEHSEPGNMCLVVVIKGDEFANDAALLDLFDLRDVNMHVAIRRSDAPILTRSGKIRLLLD